MLIHKQDLWKRNISDVIRPVLDNTEATDFAKREMKPKTFVKPRPLDELAPDLQPVNAGHDTECRGGSG